MENIEVRQMDLNEIKPLQVQEGKNLVPDNAFENMPASMDTKINFKPTVPKDLKNITPIEAATSKVNEVVTEIFSQAVVHTVREDDEIRQHLLNTAKQVVADKTNTIADMAETESKAYNFEKHLDACTYFGYDEKTTSKFHVKVMSVWAFILNTIYIFTVGLFIVSPLSFIARKLKVVIKHTWLVVVLALLIYLVVLAIPTLAVLIPKLIAGQL
jgi:hypothetical protein